MEQWAVLDRGDPAAYLELGDGEIAGEFVLTAAHASQLAALLQHATSQHPGHRPPQQPGKEPKRPATARE